MPEESIRPYFVLLLSRRDVSTACLDLPGDQIRAEHFRFGQRDINHSDKVIFSDVDGQTYTIKERTTLDVRPEKIIKRPDSFKELGLPFPLRQ